MERKCISFTADYLIYCWDFKLNKRKIYHEDHWTIEEIMIFEKQTSRKEEICPNTAYPVYKLWQSCLETGSVGNIYRIPNTPITITDDERKNQS